MAIGKTDFINEVKINETDKSGFASAIELAKTSDVVIMVLGEHGFKKYLTRSPMICLLAGVVPSKHLTDGRVEKSQRLRFHAKFSRKVDVVPVRMTSHTFRRQFLSHLFQRAGICRTVSHRVSGA